MCSAAFAQEEVSDDLSWWGQSGSTPVPYKDAVRSGYWWWPTEPASNANDAELWGNRGIVYGMYTEKVEAPAPVPPAPEPKVERQKPALSHVLFDFDKYQLKAEGKADADTVVQWMKDNAKDTLLIEGHTCNVGADDYNTGLGQRRADAVKKYLLDSGVDPNRVATQSFGESQAAVPNDTPANRKLNRRVVFNLTLVD
jgi:outer membrane protein OmpA-like peptidoglycan-associated protein